MIIETILLIAVGASAGALAGLVLRSIKTVPYIPLVAPAWLFIKQNLRREQQRPHRPTAQCLGIGCTNHDGWRAKR